MQKTDNITAYINKHATPYTQTADLEPLIKEASKARYVMLGEASHGTSEFYTIRAEITKHLIEEHGYSFVAVEGDWPPCFEVNRYVKGMAPEYSTARDVLRSFNRWPQWMWANEEIIPLIEWMKEFNKKQPARNQAGFYGLDVYSLWESMEAIIEYLEKIKSPDVEKAKNAFECFEPFNKKPEKYGVSAAYYGEDCMEEMLEMLRTLRQNKSTYDDDPEASLNMQANAVAASNAEAYYHAMVSHDAESWNIRDKHMMEALRIISEHYGTGTKGIVWEHNTHIGDARATDMASEGMVNVGQLAREMYGEEDVYAVGFGTHRGTVIAGAKWGAIPEKLVVPKGVAGSWEDLLHKSGSFNKFIMFNEENRKLFRDIIGHRAIGVVYHPEMEHLGNYVPSRISERYDAFIHVDETKALTPLNS
ncbi:erythromycin esterase family protein [Evansella clarkii]|jgi:erythromycin esterase-like protein|uniref:erythromycin esterase family protein n=1 Tax=Evansella clarkii TaxID=79879 RepID=UPI0009988A32|nr:erythromycin esterase family protein [Evansella clarkii]